MTTENDNFATMNENDGEEVTFGDLSNISLFLGARFMDQILAKTIPYLPNGNFEGDPAFQGEYGKSIGFTAANRARAFCLMTGGAYPWVGTGYGGLSVLATNQVGFAPGTILQLIGDDDTGTDAQLLPFTFKGNEVLSIAANTSGNPRVDLIEIALSYVQNGSQSRDFEDATTGANTTVSVNKTRQVQCVYQIKQGTPAASPVMPTPDAGFCALGAVVVNAGYAITTQIVAGVDTGGAGAVLYDHRIPLGAVRSYIVPASLMLSVNNFALTGTPADSRQASATSATLWIPCPGAHSGRLLGIGLLSQIPGASIPTAKIGRLAYSGSAYTFTEIASVSNLVGALAGHTQIYMLEPLDQIESDHVPSAGPTVQPDATNLIGPPIWTSGKHTPDRPFEASVIGPAEFDQLCLQIVDGTATPPGITVWKAVFFIAEGL